MTLRGEVIAALKTIPEEFFKEIFQTAIVEKQSLITGTPDAELVALKNKIIGIQDFAANFLRERQRSTT